MSGKTVILLGQLSDPICKLQAGEGAIWIDRSVTPSRLMFKNSQNISSPVSIAGGGSATIAKTGAGNPNGVVTSDVGDVYHDTTNDILYTNTSSGSGTTWSVV